MMIIARKNVFFNYLVYQPNNNQDNQKLDDL